MNWFENKTTQVIALVGYCNNSRWFWLHWVLLMSTE
jgi:hypothetical protein